MIGYRRLWIRVCLLLLVMVFPLRAYGQEDGGEEITQVQQLSDEDKQVLEHLDLLQHFDLLRDSDIELLENFEMFLAN